MHDLSDKKIIDCWKNNVQPWVTAVRSGAIESRVLVTNQTIINAICSRQPATVLDVGCGEGWLVRELDRSGIHCVGIDVVPELIEQARHGGGGTFHCLSMTELSAEYFGQKFDAVICNFSLLGKESVEHFFTKVSTLLNAGGALIVQTIHPVSGCGERPYADGWREGSWAGCGDDFSAPAPWYFRTLENWRYLFTAHDLPLVATLEPLHPMTKATASIVFVGEAAP